MAQVTLPNRRPLLLRAGLIPEAHMIGPAQRGPRDLMRARLRLVEKCVSAQGTG